MAALSINPPVFFMKSFLGGLTSGIFDHVQELFIGLVIMQQGNIDLSLAKAFFFFTIRTQKIFPTVKNESSCLSFPFVLVIIPM